MVIKEKNTKDLLIFGSSKLISLLTDKNLIDEFRLFLMPFIFGSGKKLFLEGSFKNLKLNESKNVNQNFIYVNYKVQKTN